MSLYKEILLRNKYHFSEKSFKFLMQNRIYKVLLVCSNYDAFMLEEDGRIDEMIFNEYVSLNLRYPPVFIHSNNTQEAMKILQSDTIDLVILMLNIDETDIFDFSKEIKHEYENTPIVVLTNFSHKVSKTLMHEDLSAIDYVFSWLGNANLLLAIIKLIEDKMNVRDIKNTGVQAILLVEDSIRYYSSYLPSIYKMVFNQTKNYMSEALNEHQRTLRRRGRPKILMATSYEEAYELYTTYKDNILGIVSDISYPKDGKKTKDAGIQLCKIVRSEEPTMPFLLQSSNDSNKRQAHELGVGFIYKYSTTLSIELRDYIVRHFGFGDFVFRDPRTLREIDRAIDLREFQKKILNIPSESIEYHAKRNDVSKWLNAMALFPVARMLKSKKTEDFDTIDDIKEHIIEVISSYRLEKGRGVIAQAKTAKFDEFFSFMRIGDGSIGGKARGLAFIDSFLKRRQLTNKYTDVFIAIPRTIVLCTDIFDSFMENNDLHKIAMSEDLSDEEILDSFVKAKLPRKIIGRLVNFAMVIRKPIAVRSSSLLEDSHYQPFAGVYQTYMVPFVDDEKQMLKLITNAIKSVYASVFYRQSKAYIKATRNVIDEEKMAIVLQEICGEQYEDVYYPSFSGVARSLNFYPIGPEKQEEGIVQVAVGLGKTIVDGGVALRFSPRFPKKILQTSEPKKALNNTQREFYALDLKNINYEPTVDEKVNLVKLTVNDAERHGSLNYIASKYDFHNGVIRDSLRGNGKTLVTFNGILKHNKYPIADIFQDLLSVSQQEMGTPVELEIAVNLSTSKNSPIVFNFLQIRPIVENNEISNLNLDGITEKDTIIYANSALGNGVIDNIRDFVYVKPETFSPADTHEIASIIDNINTKFVKDNSNYVLVGPGRWGSSDPWLGIPITWAQISSAAVIVESGLENYRIDPSQGTHFFQNITSFRIGYLTINPFIDDGHYDVNFLDSMEAVYEDKYVRHVRFPKDLVIKIDGRNNKAVILKP